MDDVDLVGQLWLMNQQSLSFTEEEFRRRMGTVVRHLRLFDMDPERVQAWYQSDSSGVFSTELDFTAQVDLYALTSDLCDLIRQKYRRLLRVDALTALPFGVGVIMRVLEMAGATGIPVDGVPFIGSNWGFGFVCLALLVTLGRVANDVYQLRTAGRSPAARVSSRLPVCGRGLQ
jgi:hypothetical protein